VKASKSEGIPSSPASQAPQSPPPAGLVGDLVAVLNDTKSVDAFLVTVELLQKMGAEARPAVPAVIRNAERLGILKKSALSSEKGKRGGIVDKLLENLERMAGTADESAAKTHGVADCNTHPRRTGIDLPAWPPIEETKGNNEDTNGGVKALPGHEAEGKPTNNIYSSDPNRRIFESLNNSEDLPKIEYEWKRIWFTDHPSHLTPERVDGAIQ
jgi:hypothetical protein